MTEPKPSIFPLAIMSMWYLLLALGALLWFLFGILWSSEAYRGDGMPLIEWATILGPLLLTSALLIVTISLWKKGKRQITYAMFGVSLLVIPVFLSVTGLVAL